MTTCNLQIAYPDRASGLDQDEEWINLIHENGSERIRLHEYGRFFDIPGLYEEVVYNHLRCDSPRVLTELLQQTMRRQAESDQALRVLDFGAGNGIVGECLQQAVKPEAIVGVDIIASARKAALRDRPDVYDDYYVMDLSRADGRAEKLLARWQFNALVTVAALGFGDIPTRAFVNAFNMVADRSWVAFNIKDRFFSDDDDTGYHATLREMIGRSLKVYRKHRYCHRLSIAGDPLYYYAVIGRKENDF